MAAINPQPAAPTQNVRQAAANQRPIMSLPDGFVRRPALFFIFQHEMAMEIIFLLLLILLVIFSLLALFDGFYLHIVKYRLFEHEESKLEHRMHLARAVLFPFILYFLYLRNDSIAFWIGSLFVVLDIVVLGIDAYLEGDSRAFMGGLPRWEYILHLFVNGFHFAGVAVYYTAKIHLLPSSIEIIDDFSGVYWHGNFIICVQQMLPGAIFMALLHIVTSYEKTTRYWNMLIKRR